MTPEERARLERDAREILDYIDRPFAHRVARVVLAALENPALFVPDTHFIGQRPELFEKGIPQR